MRLNIFRNPFIDAQVSMLVGSFDDSVRRQTEDYWRNEIASEVIRRCTDTPTCEDCLIIADTIRKSSARKEWF